MDNQQKDPLKEIMSTKSSLTSKLNNRMVKIVLIVLTVFVIIAVGIGIFVFLFTNRQGMQSISNLQLDTQAENNMDQNIPSGWLLYKNNTTGISFNYPGDWIIKEQGQENLVTRIYKDEETKEKDPLGAYAIIISANSDFTNKTIQQKIELDSVGSELSGLAATSGGSATNEVKEINVNGKTGYTLIKKLSMPNIGELKSIITYFADEYAGYTISVGASLFDPTTTGSPEEIKIIYDNIVSSFRFSKNLSQIFEKNKERLTELRKIIDDFNKIQAGLTAYQRDKKTQPFPPIGGNRLGVDVTKLTSNGFDIDGETVYVDNIPKHALTPEYDYLYYLCDEDNFLVEFFLPDSIDGIAAGTKFFQSPGGLRSDYYLPQGEARTTVDESCLDQDFDGLSNYFEEKYDTDKNNPDTDGDGFLDGIEVMNGYDPKD